MFQHLLYHHPPLSLPLLWLECVACTVIGIFIIVMILGGEPVTTMPSSEEWVSRCDSSKSINSYRIFIFSTSHFKQLVVKVGSGLVGEFKINSYFPIASFGHTVQSLESVPEFAIQISKSILIVSPWSVEISRSILPPLYHCPSATRIAIHFSSLKRSIAPAAFSLVNSWNRLRHVSS